MKKSLLVFGCTAGGALIGFYGRLLNNPGGCVLFILGILLVLVSFISIVKEAKKDKEEK